MTSNYGPDQDPWRRDEQPPRRDDDTQVQPPYRRPPSAPPPPVPGRPSYGPPQHGAPQHGGPQHGGPQHGSPQYGTPQYGTPQYGTPQYGTPQYGTSQYGTSQYGSPQYGSPQYDSPEYGEPEDGGPARRRRWLPIAAVAGAVVVVLGLCGGGLWTLSRSGAPEPQAGGQVPGLATSANPTTGPAPTTPARTTPARTTTKPKPKPTPTPTKKPPKSQLPPPIPKPAPSSPPPGCVKDPGPDASNADVKSALAAAGARHFWQGVQPPTGMDPSEQPALVNIDVPLSLMKAIAFTESSWRSTVISCDGGVGLMQIMSGTETYLNGRFGEGYDRAKLADNAMLGSANLQWLTAYFGLYYFDGSFNLDATTTRTDGGTPMTLRDVVIAAYNVGYSEVENTHNTDDASDDTLSIPNQWYVDRVYTNIAQCPCAAW